jgi:hypothetical protein
VRTLAEIATLEPVAFAPRRRSSAPTIERVLRRSELRRSMGCRAESAIVLLALLAGCAPRAGVLVRIDAQHLSRSSADRVVITVLGAPDGSPSVGPLEIEPAELPYTILVTPAAGDAARFRLEAQLWEGSRRVGTLSAETGFRDGAFVVLPLCFEDACRGVSCEDDTCRAGACEPPADPVLFELDATTPECACTPGCIEGVQVTCDPSPVLVECPLGCSGSEPTRCARLQPFGVAGRELPPPGTAAVRTTCPYSTSICDSQCGFTSTTRTADGLCVVQAGDVVIAAGATLQVSGDRPLVILAAGDVTIEGTLDASATGSTPGPGGGASSGGPMPGGAGGASFVEQAAGGGGGGLQGSGGRGGDAVGYSGGPGGTGSAIAGLRGGSGGGVQGGVGAGAGGGAIQISAGGAIVVRGTISAGGGGGPGGPGAMFGGAGGGSGGTIVLEAAEVDLGVARIVAPGGGGGGGGLISFTDVGGACSYPAGSAGTDGRDVDETGVAGGGASSPAAAGGAGGDIGDGAPGGLGNTDPRSCGSFYPTYGSGGGGGGGAGCVLVRNASGTADYGAPALARPAITVSAAERD